VEYLLKYVAAAEGIVDVQSFITHPWLRNAADMPLHLALPRSAWDANNMFVNLADSPRICWYGPHYQLYRLASLYGRPEVQWLAEQVRRSGITENRADWLSLLWFDPSVVPRAPDTSVKKLFPDWDVAVMRGGGQGNETLCVFRCSPVGGHQPHGRMRLRYPGSGHCQPDANSFTVFGSGQWLVADAGATRVKRTRYHNTVLVNGVGQLGEGERWFDGREQFAGRRKARFAFLQAGPGYEYVVGDASDIYREDAALTTFLRHFFYLRPGLIVVVDELESKGDAVYEWLLHTPGEIRIRGGNRALIRQGDAWLKIAVLRPSAVEMNTSVQEIEAEHPDRDWTRLNVLSLKPRAARRKCCFTVVLLSTGDEETPFDPRAVGDAPAMRIAVGLEGVSATLLLEGVGRRRRSPGILKGVQ
jgi:hypothetical protein